MVIVESLHAAACYFSPGISVALGISIMVYQFPHVGHFRSLHGTRASSAPLISCLIFLIYTRCTNKNHATASVLRWSTVLSAE